MAFSTPYVDRRGVAYTSTYCRATVAYAHKNETGVQVLMYTDESCAPSFTNGGKEPVEQFLVRCNTEMELVSNNPVEYAYKLLEASGRFPEAVWNI